MIFSQVTPHMVWPRTVEREGWERCDRGQELSRQTHINAGRKASPCWGWWVQEDPAMGQSGSRNIFFFKARGSYKISRIPRASKEQESREADREPVSSTLSEGLQPRVQKWIVVGWGWEVWHGTRTDRFFFSNHICILGIPSLNSPWLRKFGNYGILNLSFRDLGFILLY